MSAGGAEGWGMGWPPPRRLGRMGAHLAWCVRRSVQPWGAVLRWERRLPAGLGPPRWRRSQQGARVRRYLRRGAAIPSVWPLPGRDSRSTRRVALDPAG